MSNNKIKLVVEVDEYCRDAIIRHRNGTYGAQLPYYIISSAFEAIANGTPYNPSGDLISREALIKDIEKRCGEPFNYIKTIIPTLRAIDNALTVDLKDIYQEGHYDGHLEGYTKAINEKRPQGTWVLVHPLQEDDEGAYMCSECHSGDWRISTEFKFCPNCGGRDAERR